MPCVFLPFALYAGREFDGRSSNKVSLARREVFGRFYLIYQVKQLPQRHLKMGEILRIGSIMTSVTEHLRGTGR